MSAQPKHIAIIMDGNGRWAKARGLPRTAGHKKGADAMREVIKACRELKIEYLTVYAFSSENWRRPPAEVSDLMGLLQYTLERELTAMHGAGVRLRVIGDHARLSAAIRTQLEAAEEKTRNNTALNLTVALSYGARQEIIAAARALAEKVATGEMKPEELDEAAFSGALATHDLPDPDLLIRTGGEMRLSNFLLWQSAYTELYFTETLWPEFGRSDLEDALKDFASRERRYGNAA